MKECKKLVLVAVDNFSSYMCTTFINSEQRPDLRDGIIKTITLFMASSRIRVDRAPGFSRMANQTEALANMGIDLELGNAKNKNAIAIVDQKIKELRQTLKRISPSSNVLNQLCLSKATTLVNESIRHHKLSAKEIHFSRSMVSNERLQVEDKDIADTITKHRETNNPDSARAKSKTKIPATSAKAMEGQLVFVKQEGDKRKRRDIYLVLETDKVKDTAIICKVRDAISNKLATIAPHNQQFRYIVNQTDLILAPNQPKKIYKFETVIINEDMEDDNEVEYQHLKNNFNEETQEEDEEEAWECHLEQENCQFTNNKEAEAATLAEEEAGQSHEEEEQAEKSHEEEEQVENTIVEGEQENDDHTEPPKYYEENEDLEQEVLFMEHELEENEAPNKLPTRGKFIKFRRQNENIIPQDQYIPSDSWTLAKITAKLKMDRFGRTYFNLLYTDGAHDGIYLTMPPNTHNDFLWHFIQGEKFENDTIALQQLDGATFTPDTLSPQYSLELNFQPNELSLSTDSQEWDHSPERLTEDDAILWEPEPLQPLSANEIGEEIIFNFAEKASFSDAPQETITSPLGIFKRQPALRKKTILKRQPAFRRKKTIPRPTHLNDVVPDQTTNLEALLLVYRPLLPELISPNCWTEL